ncbi:MAG: hypothetical protein KTR31_08615 [Myxococcales bacterium]|nr:hypothetical protein [Myxococcales bacterium]
MPVERVVVDLAGARMGLVGAMFRYGVLQRMRRCSDRREVAFLAFGFEGEALRVVLEGSTHGIGNALRGAKVGTVRALDRWGIDLRPSPAVRIAVGDCDLLQAVAWAHRAPRLHARRGPLGSPWTSHRDVLGFRSAPFYDPSLLHGRVDPRRLHAICGGRPLPRGWPPPPGERERLTLLLQVAAAVLGVLPADRRCFRLFVHLARLRGWDTRAIAEALALTRRRVRQMLGESVEELQMALAMISDIRLGVLP